MLQPLVTEQVPEPENEENEWSTQYRKWDFALPVLVPVLEMGLPFPVLVNCGFGHLHMHVHVSNNFLECNDPTHIIRIIDVTILTYTNR